MKITNTTGYDNTGYGFSIALWNICIANNIPASQPPAVPTVTIAGHAKAEGNFRDRATVTLGSTNPAVSIYYTTDGTPTTSASTLYTAPFDLSETATLRTVALLETDNYSAVRDTLITVTPSSYRITAPKDATVYVGDKDQTVEVAGNYLTKHYVPFTKMTETYTTETATDKTWYYDLPAPKNSSGGFSYRVTRAGKAPHVGLFKPGASDRELVFTDGQLSARSASDIDHDVNNLAGRNVADVFININPQGHLHLPLKTAQQTDTVFQLINTRNWQAIDTDVNNYFIEPDFHYTVLNEDGTPGNDVITVSDSGKITPRNAGTAIVLVSYDAMLCHHTTNVGGADVKTSPALFSALWPENTGVFVVSVGDRVTDVTTNMTVSEYWSSDGTDKTSGIGIDAEHDVLYYETSTGGYDYTFKPEGVMGVMLSRPAVEINTLSYAGGFNAVEANPDGSYTVRLTFGRNIIKLLNAQGAAVYQVITAKPVTYTVANVTRPGEVFRPGDEFAVTFSTLYHPSNKMSGIYNMSAGIQYSGFGTDFALILGPGQYTFASRAQEYKRQIPADYTGDDIVLGKGVIKVKGFGSYYGEHRKITQQNGVAPNLSASVREAYFGSLPDVRIHTVGAPPTVPGNLQALSRSQTAIALAWTASTDNVGVAGYRIWKDGTLLATLPPTTLAYQAQNLTAETSYTFEVAAFDASENVSAKATLAVSTLAANQQATPVTGVTLNHAAKEMTVGDALQLTATVAPANADNKAVTWTSSNPAIATVNINGLVTALSTGTAVIAATTADGHHTATCVITAVASGGDEVNPFELTQRTLSLYPGQTVSLSLTAPQHFTVAWTSSNTSVATVSSTGLVTSIAAGTAVITARDASKNKSDACTVTVLPLPNTQTESMSLNTSSLTLTQGETSALRVTTSPGLSSQAVVWSTSNRNVADVTAGGTVIAIAASGTATITATIGAYSATCLVTVAPQRINAGVDDIGEHDARLSFVKLTGASYYLVHLYKKEGLALNPVYTLKVTPGGEITLRSSAGNNLVVPLNYLSPGTVYFIDIESIRETDGRVETIQTESMVFTTAGVPTGIERLPSTVLKARVQNGRLYVSGLQVGRLWSVYNISGTLIHRDTAVGAEDHPSVHLPARGVYIVQSGSTVIKVIY